MFGEVLTFEDPEILKRMQGDGTNAHGLLVEYGSPALCAMEEIMKSIRPWLAVTAVLLLVAAGASAQDQILALKNQIIDLQNKGKLAFLEAALCSKVIGFGSYVPLEKPVVKKGGDLLVYYQPQNVFTNRVKGHYEIWYTQDVVLLSKAGEVLFEQKDFLEFHYSSRTPVFDLFATNTLNLGATPAGSFVYRAVLHDRLKDASTEYSMPFEIAP